MVRGAAICMVVFYHAPIYSFEGPHQLMSRWETRWFNDTACLYWSPMSA
jgi:peptidoglycan/LPS O-acetylase OafA/YrhL